MATASLRCIASFNAMRASPALTARHLTRRMKRALPPGLIFTLKRLAGRRPPPPVGRVRFGDFDRTSPISPDFGFDRGTPVDRYYVEAFLAAHSGDIRGRALEVGDDSYCRKFGTGIVRQDVLHVTRRTIRGRRSSAIFPFLVSYQRRAFDCLVVTQTLHLIYDMHAAVAAMHRALEARRRPSPDLPRYFPDRPGEVGCNLVLVDHPACR